MRWSTRLCMSDQTTVPLTGAPGPWLFGMASARTLLPDFEAKLVDVVGLYLDPPAKAVVFSFDEKVRHEVP